MNPVRRQTVSLSFILSAIGISIIVVLFLIYVLFQARLLIIGPKISLDANLDITQSSRAVTLTGTAENITEITLNGRNIETSEHGQFNENIVLENGYNIVSIQAQDRYGRTTVVEKEFVYAPLSVLPN